MNKPELALAFPVTAEQKRLCEDSKVHWDFWGFCFHFVRARMATEER